MCDSTGKVAYPSSNAAMQAIKHIGRTHRYNGGSGGNLPYKCSLCHGWHLGRPNKAVKAKRRDKLSRAMRFAAE